MLFPTPTFDPESLIPIVNELVSKLVALDTDILIPSYLKSSVNEPDGFANFIVQISPLPDAPAFNESGFNNALTTEFFNDPCILNILSYDATMIAAFFGE